MSDLSEEKSGKDMQIAQKIKQLRKERGMTQVQLAQKMGITVTYVAYFETGYRLPTIPMLRRLATVLGVQVRDLIPF